jgi:hypothetical protein
MGPNLRQSWHPETKEHSQFEYLRHGTLSWFFNFDVITGQVIEPSWEPTHNEEDHLAHLQRLITSDPAATKWHILVDNLNTHQSESLVCWIAENKSWLSLPTTIEPWSIRSSGPIKVSPSMFNLKDISAQMY